MSPPQTSPPDTRPAKTTPPRISPAQTSPAQTSPAQTSPARTSPAQTSPAQTSPAQTSPGLPPFDRVVVEHGPVVLRVLTALAGPQRAEDCFQETFLAALRAYPRLRPDSNLRAWLLTIARNKTIDAARAAARSAVPVDPLEGLPEHAAPGADPAEVPGLGELAGLDDAGLRAGLHQLSERLRTAVVGRHAADLSYDDLAALLDTTPAAARRAVSDGLAELRRTVPAATTSAAQHQKEKP